MLKKMAIVLLVTSIFISMPVFADDTEFDFKAGMALGTDVIKDSTGDPKTWNSLALTPEFKIGPVGLGLDLKIRFNLMPTPTDAIEIYPGDWIINYNGNGKTIWDLYLPKFLYISYGERGEPFYAAFGSVENMTLGNGFIMGNYSNRKFLPELRIAGLDIGLDGALFNFPYVGFEVLTGNLAKFDVLGGRLFVRPMIWSSIPIIKDIQIGATYVTDLDPDLYMENVHYSDSRNPDDAAYVWGADIYAPILKSELFPLVAFAEMAFEQNNTFGSMLGASGKIIGFITYGAQLRLMQSGFIPTYFDGNYDLYRYSKREYMRLTADKDFLAGWLARAGTSFFDDGLYFYVSLDGPFKGIPTTVTANYADYPHLDAKFVLKEDILGGFSLEAGYEKYFIGKENSFFGDLFSAKDAVIQAALSYATGGAKFTITYNLIHNPESANGFDVTSSLTTAIQF